MSTHHARELGVRNLCYVHDENMVPHPCDDRDAWARFMGGSKQFYQRDVLILSPGQSMTVSTTFLGVDHGHGGGSPILWETSLFGNMLKRYTTFEDAMVGHKAVVDKLLEDYPFAVHQTYGGAGNLDRLQAT